MGSEPLPDPFRALAGDYDRLRPADANWLELLDVLVEEGRLLGRRVLDVGCGTGRVALALAERGCRVWGVDPSAEMLSEARARAGRRVAFKRAEAESLPFRSGWFDRAVLRLVVHHVDRSRALPEVARVLASDGCAVVATFRTDHIEGFWLNPYFPSLRAIDEARFPSPEALGEELRGAGFVSVRERELTQRVETTRAEALERLRGRFISTLHLLPEGELEAGTARAERELPATVVYELRWAILTATR
jgi:SAM-dependent methyltransferase